MFIKHIKTFILCQINLWHGKPTVFGRQKAELPKSDKINVNRAHFTLEYASPPPTQSPFKILS